MFWVSVCAHCLFSLSPMTIVPPSVFALHPSNPLMIFVAFCRTLSNKSVSFFCWWVQHPRCISAVLSRGEDHLLNLLLKSCSFTLLRTRSPSFSSAKLLSIHGFFSLYWCMKLFLPGCSIINLSLLNLIKFISHFSCLSSEWQHTHMVFQLLLPVLPCLQTVWRCIPSSHGFWSRTDGWGMLPGIDLQLNFMSFMTTHWAWPLS